MHVERKRGRRVGGCVAQAGRRARAGDWGRWRGSEGTGSRAQAGAGVIGRGAHVGRPGRGCRCGGRQVRQAQARTAAASIWLTPPRGRLKLNVDGAFNKQSGEAGGGGILRDHNGDMQWAFATPYHDLKTSLAAEALALRDGLRLCSKMDASEVQIETDSLNLVHIVTTQTPRPRDLSFILQEIVVAAAKVKAEIMYAPREGNKVADYLAEFAVSCACFTLLDRWADLPSNVMDSCHHDKAGHQPKSPESLLYSSPSPLSPHS
ncbi:hypothetical protein Taro_002073 [Colocasia esculenta]|uniref:RNase H type-1 domain-containing protein n=1 Tax=Colocasia esculenta TaxID=4460 RepID=A0A843TJX0_COLES|nr:hypothetical protein [Colocasia esculenta]